MFERWLLAATTGAKCLLLIANRLLSLRENGSSKVSTERAKNAMNINSCCDVDDILFAVVLNC